MGTHGKLYPPISRTPSLPAARNWGQTQRRPYSSRHITSHPSRHITVTALQLCITSDSVTILHRSKDHFAEAWLSRQPFRSGHTGFFQDDERLAVKISQPLYNSFQSSHATQPASFLSHKFPVFHTNGHSWNLVQDIFWCFQHIPNLLKLSCALAVISQSGRHSAGEI